MAVGEGAEAALEGVVEALLARPVGGVAEEGAAAERAAGVDAASAVGEEAASAVGPELGEAVAGDDEGALEVAGVEAIVIAGEVAALAAGTTLGPELAEADVEGAVDGQELLGDGVGERMGHVADQASDSSHAYRSRGTTARRTWMRWWWR